MGFPVQLLKPNGDNPTLVKAPPLLVHLAIPTRDNHIHGGQFGAIYQASASGFLKGIQIEHGSWLQRNMNNCLAAALNQRKNGVTHFCMMHDDVVPLNPDWFTKLITLSQVNQADIMSVVVPLKIGLGLTSTALDEPVRDLDQRFRVKRLTLHEIYNDFKPTFTHPNLLANTGLVLIDIRKPWIEEVSFKFVDAIQKDKDGVFSAVGFSEDWQFSRDAKQLGASIWATREVHVEHMGNGQWSNAFEWGKQLVDQ